MKQRAPAVAGAPFSKKQHFSSKPKLAPGASLIATHFVEFSTKDGAPDDPPIRAKVFLIAIHPELTGNAKALARNPPGRIFGSGFEIEHHGGPNDNEFIPDFVVDKRFVDRIANKSSFTVNLGDVKYRVVTTRGP